MHEMKRNWRAPINMFPLDIAGFLLDPNLVVTFCLCQSRNFIQFMMIVMIKKVKKIMMQPPG